jgi:hypothetical protein
MKRRTRDEDEATDGGPLPERPLFSLLLGDAASGYAGIAEGQAVEVEQEGDWWAATVLRLLDNGLVRIHYTGWAATFDENVTRNRIRFPTPPAYPVRVELTNGRTVTGTLTGEERGFLALVLPDARRLLLNTAHVLTVEAVTPEPVEARTPAE